MKKHIDLQYVSNETGYLQHVFSVFGKYFLNREDFDSYYHDISSDLRKDTFLKVGSFYKYLVKDGYFTFDDAKLNCGMSYINESYKFMSIFSLIESIYVKDNHLDFYQYLARKKTKLKYPIKDRADLDRLYDSYKDEYGCIKSAVKFFENIGDSASKLLCNKLRMKDKGASVVELSQLLYKMRSEFVHSAKFIATLGNGTYVSLINGKIVICDLQLDDLEYIFESGFLHNFRK